MAVHYLKTSKGHYKLSWTEYVVHEHELFMVATDMARNIIEDNEDAALLDTELNDALNEFLLGVSAVPAPEFTKLVNSYSQTNLE